MIERELLRLVNTSEADPPPKVLQDITRTTITVSVSMAFARNLAIEAMALCELLPESDDIQASTSGIPPELGLGCRSETESFFNKADDISVSD